MEVLNERSKRILEKVTREDRVQLYLNALRKHHLETYVHSLRVGLVSVDIGVEKGYDKDDLFLICYAGILHDIGKLNIPPALLSKPGSLMPFEWDIIKKHPVIGFKMLKDFEPKEVKDIVHGHHLFKKEDPYPKDLVITDPKTIMFTEIVAVCDMCDALLNVRSYKPAFSKDQARATLQAEFTGDDSLLPPVLERY